MLSFSAAFIIQPPGSTSSSSCPMLLVQVPSIEGMLLFQINVQDANGFKRAIIPVRLGFLNVRANIHSSHYAPENGVLSIEPRGWHGGDEKLAAIGIFSRIGHGDCKRTIMSQVWNDLVL